MGKGSDLCSCIQIWNKLLSSDEAAMAGQETRSLNRESVSEARVLETKNLLLLFDRCLFQDFHEEIYQQRVNNCAQAELQLKGCDRRRFTLQING